MSANEPQRGPPMTTRGCLARAGLVLIAAIALWLAPGQLWLRRQLADIDRLKAEARRHGGSASIPPGGIAVGERRIAVLLDLPGTGVGDPDLAKLAAMPAFRHVRFLNLERTRVTGEGLKPLEDNANLILLNLSGSRVSDNGLETIATLPFLNVLYLNGTNVSDAGLNALIERRGRRRIGSIDLRGTRVTADGVRSLEAAFDQLVIDHPAARHPAIRSRP